MAGNVRELEHVIESAVNMAGYEETTLRLEHCYFVNLLGKDNNSGFDYSKPLRTIDSVDNLMEKAKAETEIFDLVAKQSQLEKNTIIKALETTGYNIAKAAMLLGISRQLLGYKMKKHKLRLNLLKIKLNSI